MACAAGGIHVSRFPRENIGVGSVGDRLSSSPYDAANQRNPKIASNIYRYCEKLLPTNSDLQRKLTMAQSSLIDLTQEAAKADGPSFTPAGVPKLGGVDPLGLRQINFDLMDQVLPGLNNVARHIRPFVVVTWAWRRAKQLAERQ